MLRILLGFILSCLLAMPALAGSYYVGPTLVYTSIKVTGITYGGISPRLSLGYEDFFNDNYYYLAGEVFLSPTTASIDNGPDKQGSLRISYTYGFSVIPGINLDNTIIAYLRFGAVRSRFINEDEVKGGFQYGGGLQYVINDCWSVRGDYVRTIYSSIPVIGDPKADQYSIGLMYRFA